MTNVNVPKDNVIYFQHKTLIGIIGQTNFGSLNLLADELKANANSLPSVLGGGMYGHLAPLNTVGRRIRIPY